VVVAVDYDELVIDKAYKDFLATGARNILPLVVDIADPSPALGWLSTERSAFLGRFRVELVMCLGLVHHLVFSRNVPISLVVRMLRSFDAPVILEVATEKDPMVEKIVRRKLSRLPYSLPLVEKELEIAERRQLSSQTRVMFSLDPL
jgi:hypothetical protein